MRRENRKGHAMHSNITLYITGGVLLAAIAAFVISFILYSQQLGRNIDSFDTDYLAKYDVLKEEKNETASASSSVGKTVEESKEELEQNKTIPSTAGTSKETKEKVQEQGESLKQKKNISATKKVEKDPIFQKPIEGEIVKEFAQEHLIYSETLKEWITHLGVDLKAEKATVVKAAADGTVRYIKNDPRFGLTIIIEHSNGFETRYANLLTTEFVAEGEEVKAGQTIGTVGDTSVYEIVDEPHLHFEILKNNENVNPQNYISF